jgi:adenylylsulfate kinase-like enzyme
MYDVVFLNGSVGVGKTTVAEAVTDAVAAMGVAAAFVDIDALRRRRPPRTRSRATAHRRCRERSACLSSAPKHLASYH